MRRKPSHTKLGVPALSCAVVLAILAAAQVSPLAISSSTGGTGAQTPTPAAVSPTPSPRIAPLSPPLPRSGRRDLSRYDQAGPLAVPAGLPRAAREAVMAQVRAFLLDHWRGQRLGHLVTHMPGAQGGTEPWAFYVEPGGGRGEWAITLEAGGRTETFTFVEEVWLPGDGPPVLEPGVESRSPRAGTKALHLKQNAEAMSGLVL